MTRKEHNEYNRRWARAHPERVREIQRRHRENHPGKYVHYYAKYYKEHREEKLASSKKWRERNREAYLARRRQFYLNNRDRIKKASKQWSNANSGWRRIYMKEWRADNADKVKAQKERWNRENHDRVLQHKRSLRARYSTQLNEYLRNWVTKQREALVERLFSKCSGICYICGNPLDLNNRTLEVDHYIPVCLGGSNNEDNFRLTHRTCNRQKSGKHPVNVLRFAA